MVKERSINLNETNTEDSRYSSLGKGVNYLRLLDVSDRYEHLIGISNVVLGSVSGTYSENKRVVNDNLGRVIKIGNDVKEERYVVRNDKGYSEGDLEVIRKSNYPGLLGMDRGSIVVSAINYPDSLVNVKVKEVVIEDGD